jgi:ABC-type phosphate/phosphonate transport system ATPase subunit
MPDAAIRVRGAIKTYALPSGAQAVAGIDLDIQPGEFVAVAAPAAARPPCSTCRPASTG